VTRTGLTDRTSSVRYFTSDGTATQRSDYTFAAGTLTFAAGETQKQIPILITDDAYAEGTESLNITLIAPQGAALGSPSTTTLLIIDNDNSNGSVNPIDDASLFVGEHYHDFLNRQSDTAGQNFWANQIASCGGDPQCIEAKRINVSAAFYLSIEFQQTGYLVERIYKAAFGDASATSTFNGAHQLAVPVVRLDEFLTDTQEISQNVVVLQPGWQDRLEANKNSFAAEFVTRDRFIAAFPSDMSPAAFVDKLNANAGNPLSQAERDQLVSDLTNGAKTRADVLRAVAEDPSLSKTEFNRAFVLMQYFGYLRRNPDSAPDADYTGFDFWLTKLNNFNGDYLGAEMVKAFLSSSEYRERFQGGANRGNPSRASAMNFPTVKDAVAKSIRYTLPLSLVTTLIG
jgi:hypothetical protein